MKIMVLITHLALAYLWDELDTFILQRNGCGYKVLTTAANIEQLEN